MAFVGALTCSRETTAGTRLELTVQVMLLNEVVIPDKTTSQAQAETSRIFKAAGITLTWLPSGEVPANYLIIEIVKTPIGQISRNPNVLGVSPGSKEVPGRVAWLYYDRIQDLARFLHLEVAQLLGHVMAHEMGHLLLPSGAHAAGGLMKAGWDNQQAILAATGSLTFEASQAALIRTRLRGKTNR